MVFIKWKIKANRSHDLLIAATNDNDIIIDYQLQLINSQEIKYVFPLAVIKRAGDQIISAVLGKNNTFQNIDIQSKGDTHAGLHRLIQLAEAITKIEDNLFLPNQILPHPDTIRYRMSDKTDENNNYEPVIVVFPVNVAIDHDDIVLEKLFPIWSEFYGFPADLQQNLKYGYENSKWLGLVQAANDVFDNKITTKKNQDKKTVRNSDSPQKDKTTKGRINQTLLPIIWCSISAVFLVLSRISILSSWRSFRIIFGILLVILGIYLILKSSNLDTVRKWIQKLQLPKPSFLKEKTSTNCTELITRNAESYGMAMLSEGLPGTPQENEGIRAFILLDEFIIGRDEEQTDLCLENRTVGRRHARISRHEGSYFIADLGSKNGTRVDGRRLNRNEEYLLPDRCRLQFADCVLFFQNEEPL